MNLSGPIPGENFTSDTKNYPWHRPPEFTDLDKAIDMIAKKLLSEESSKGIITMLEMGMDITTLTDTFLTSGIGAGKWTPDFALLLAGPVSHIIVLMAKGYDIDYDLGIDQKTKAPTSSFFKEVRNRENAVKVIKENIDVSEVKEKAAAQPQGLMAMGKPQEEIPMAPEEEMM